MNKQKRIKAFLQICWRLLRRRQRTFLSSTSHDLGDWREVLAQVIEDAGLEVVRMEDFPAIAKRADVGSRSMVTRCDLFVGIYARRYGSIAPDGKSITEHEYDEANG